MSDAAFIRRAVLRLSAIEFWERYAFYTMFSLLALFVAAPVTAGGMGWSDGDSLRFFGVYLLCVQIAPLIGGWLGDRIDGRRALKLGGLFLLFGHGLLAMPNLLAWAAEQWTGLPMKALLGKAGAPLGNWTAPAALPGALQGVYLLITASFYGSVALVALGNGLFKPVLTVVVGRMPHADEGERNAAFTTFFVFLNAGGLLSTLLGGWLAQRFGWGWAFGASAAGMIVSIVTMFLLERTYIAPFIGKTRRHDVTEQDVAPVRGALLGVALLMIVFMVACIFSYQSYGFVSLFNARLVDRHVWGFEIPPSWFTALNPIAIMALSPLVAAVWRRRRAEGAWTPTVQVAAAFAAMCAGFLLLAAAAGEARAGALAAPGWVAGAIILIAASELLMTPIMQSSVTRLTPVRHQAFAIGALAGAAGLGAWLSGLLGAAAMEGDKAWALGAMAVATVACALVLLAGRAWARRRFEL